MNKFVPSEVNDRISHLMNLRRDIINREGYDSTNFIKIDHKFKKLLNRYDLVYHELHVGFKSKK